MTDVERPKTTTALVLVTYNRSSLLLDALRSINAMIVRPDAVYIIDNNSTDNTCDVVNHFISENTDCGVVYHNTGYNAGGAGGFKIGSELAYKNGFDYIWLADDDIEFDTLCFANALPYLNENTIIQPMRYNMDGSCAEISAVSYNLSNPFYMRPKRKTVRDIYSPSIDVYDLKSIPFEGPIIHRSIFKRIGFPDERFFIFNDDLDFALRATAIGVSIQCVTNSKIYRKIPFNQSIALKTWKGYFMFRNYFRIQLRYGRKPVIYFRMIFVYVAALLHSLAHGDFNGVRMLSHAFLDGVSSGFVLNKKYLP